MNAIRLSTIGFTRKSAEQFFSKLQLAGVKRIVDVRLNNNSQLAGFSKRDMTFAYYTEMEKADAAPTKITQPGLWIIRVEHIQEDKTEQHDCYDARAVFLFEVKP